MLNKKEMRGEIAVLVLKGFVRKVDDTKEVEKKKDIRKAST